MNTDEMLRKIKELQIPDRGYSINDSLGSDKYIFRKAYDYWECFYMDERGGQNNSYHQFHDENNACLFFIEMLKKNICDESKKNVKTELNHKEKSDV